jgi:hypothetical protein
MKKWNRNVGFLILFILCMAPFIVRAGNNTSRIILGQPWYDERPAMKAVIDTGTYQYGNPTAAEQAHLERINRARLDPQAEANRLLGGNINEGPPSITISTTAKQPLTFNAQLYQAARLHSQDMIANDYFTHAGSDGSSPSDQITAAGYSYNYAGDNIALDVSTAPINEVNNILIMHDSLVIDSDDPSRGHRGNIFNANFKEIGIGTASGPTSHAGTDWPYAWALTCDFGAHSGNSFVLGVVYDDTNSNGEYTAGEGIGGAVISVVRTSDSDTASTTTASAGGYGIPLPSGSYMVTARLSDGRELERDLTIAAQNVKIDFKEADFPSTPSDSIPNQFTFTDQTKKELNTQYESNTITVSGINEPADISITAGGEYKINNGSYTSASASDAVNNGDTVTVRQTSSGNYSTKTDATLTIGGVSDTFSVTTKSEHGSSGDGDGGGGGCFIATAAFGSPLAGQVEILRQFRDKYLLTNVMGKKFVSWYYNNGPIAANWIQDKPLAKVAVQAALYPLIGFSFLLIAGYLPFVTVGLLLSTLLFLRFRSKKLIDI